MQKLYSPVSHTVFVAAVILSIFPGILLAQKPVNGVIRIKVSESLASKLEQTSMSASPSGEIITGIPSLDRINSNLQVRRLTRLFPQAGKFEPRHRRHGLHLWYEVRMDNNTPVLNAIQSYRSDQHILLAEPVYEKAIIGSHLKGFGPRKTISDPGAPLSGMPDDPLLQSQWHYNNTGQTGGRPGADIKLPDAWKIETGSPQVVIAVTDGGVQVNHPDLAANMWVNPGEIAGNSIDDDNNGYVDDVHGYGFVNKSGNILPHDHGTHVAGTLAAATNNGKGVAGIAGGSGNGDGVRVMSCAVFAYDSVPGGFAEAYVYAADNGAVISQNSWGYTLPGVFEQAVLDAIDYFIAEAGKNDSGQQVGPMDGGLVIFSAGNANEEANYYPSYYEPVIAVASTTHKDVRAYYSNYGSWVDISAPGGETDITDSEGVVSTLTNGQYGALMGTSMACPHVSGVAALIVSKYGKQGLRPDAVRKRLLFSVDDIYAYNTSYAGKLGSGRLNAALALKQGDASGPDPINNLAVEDTDVGEITLTWTSPKDDDDFVAAYDLRYSKSPITLENFSNATRVDEVPPPGAPGTEERFTVKGLPGGLHFYFAIRSHDFDGNASPISNIVEQQSALTPVIVLDPASIEQELRTAERSSRTFTIRNDGEGPLKFTLDDKRNDQTFVKADVLEGTLAPHGIRAITLTFDGAGKRQGTYQQDLIVTSNDPTAEAVILKTTLYVKDNGVPIAVVDTGTIDFKSVQVGQTVIRNLTIHNAGSNPLVVDHIACDNPSFSSHTTTPLTVAPFDDGNIRIAFAPSETGKSVSNITISSNDPGNGAIVVPLTGEGLSGAAVAATPSFFNETIAKGASVTRSLTLKNNGSQPRAYRITPSHPQLVRLESDATLASGRSKATDQVEADVIRAEKIRGHQELFAAKRGAAGLIAKSVGPRDASTSGRISQAFKRETRDYSTGFEDFTLGPITEQHGWYAMQGWTIANKNPDGGAKHFRGVSQVTGTGESYCISPALFGYEEMYYPQYTTATLRLNVSQAKGSTWEIIPQDPWSYVATRLRFNPDATLDAMVIGNDYDVSWKRVPVTIPSGYFDFAIEYNNAGSDTSGFPTYHLFVNNQHVFSGTGLAFGIGQIAIASTMETSGPIVDVDDVRVIGGEYVPPFATVTPDRGILQPGETVNVALGLDASIMKVGDYKSDLIVVLDELDSLKIPVSLTVPGDPSLWRDTYGIYWVLGNDVDGFIDIFMRNDGGKTATFTFEHHIPGLTFTPEAGSLQVREEGIIQVRFNGPPGMYDEDILLHTNINSEPEHMRVSITKFDEGAVFHAPDTLRITAIAGRLSSHTMNLSNQGINTVSYSAKLSAELANVITMDPVRATIAGTPLAATLAVDATSLSTGTTSGTIHFRTNDPARTDFYTHIILTVVDDTPGNYLLREVWTSISGRLISSIPLNSPPAFREQLTDFEAPSNAGNNYGARIRGSIQPPTSGAYTFWIASNDFSELWLSSDDSERNKVKIASVAGYTNPRQWTKFSSQKSEPVYLEAHRTYYIEALHKEGVGTDHLTVAWTLPNGTFEGPIPASRLSAPGATNTCIASGTIMREFWTRVQGTQVSDIPKATPPTGIELLSHFEGPLNAGTNYGARIRGYICPPATGAYYFWIASNDHSELWLSEDDDPANKRLIASLTRASGYREWQRYPTQKSVAVFLTAGKSYYVEALHKQGIGSDHLSVGWQLPDGTLERPIAGSHLAPFDTETSLMDGSNIHVRNQGQPGLFDVHVYPNPVEGEQLNIEFTEQITAENGKGEIIIRDITGLALYSESIKCSKECRTSIDIKQLLVPGMYILQVSAGEKTFTERLIVR